MSTVLDKVIDQAESFRYIFQQSGDAITQQEVEINPSLLVALKEEQHLLKQVLQERGPRIELRWPQIRLGGDLFDHQVDLYRKRLAEIGHIVAAIEKAYGKMFTALERGYEPYTCPKGWTTGRVERLVKSDYRLFVGIIPQENLRKYRDAKSSGMFDEFLVASPNEADFLSVSQPIPPPIVQPRFDPAIIGYINLPQEPGWISRSVTYKNPYSKHGLVEKIKIRRAGFLITMWGLKEDRATAGMDF